MEDDIVEVDVAGLETEGTVERDEVVEVAVGVIDDVVARLDAVSVVDRDGTSAALVSLSAHDTVKSATAQASEMD